MVKEKLSKYTGVCWDSNNKKWYSSIRINGKSKHLGRFSSEEDAYKMYILELNNIKND